MNQVLSGVALLPNELLGKPGGEQKLDLRIVRGPLREEENARILDEYNRSISGLKILRNEFVRWVQDSPDGPALHALLETQQHGIVGHQCLIPLRANWRGRPLIAAKSEYTFLREEFRTTKINGFEGARRPTHMVAANQLMERGRDEGWGPFLISTTPSLRRRGFYGFTAIDFPLCECLLILRPLSAGVQTPGLKQWQRGILFAAGSVQAAVWHLNSLFFRRDRNLQITSVRGNSSANRTNRLSFFEDAATLRWRYGREYAQLSMGSNNSKYLLYKKGGPKQYMRICQWDLDSKGLSRTQVAQLIQIAKRDGAIGVRWSVPPDGESSDAIVDSLKRCGFLCVRRAKTIQIKSSEAELLDPENWLMTDAMFSFHD